MIAELRVVQVFFWEGPFGTIRFSIPHAMEIIQRRDNNRIDHELTLAQAAEAVLMNPEAQKIEPDSTAGIDLTQPIIIATIGDEGCVIIDGWHRVTRQVLDNVPSIPAYILTPDETLQCIEETRKLFA